MSRDFTLITLLIVFSFATLCCKKDRTGIKKDDSIEVYKGLDICILMGQSNMSGRGLMSADDKKVKNVKVFMLTESLRWLPARNPLHFDVTSPGVGPGMSFGLAMQAANQDVEIGLVPTAVGETGIDTWKLGAFDVKSQKYPYDDAERRIIEAMNSGIIKGVLWHQGEEETLKTIPSYN